MNRPTYCRTDNLPPEECQCFRCRDDDDEPEEALEDMAWSAVAED
ncbi:hypothetical protein SAMN04244579_02672 [Azotobacter beijerinckii]|uniref:Uncharacterized protein n=1 Tax=Azotobacter beijerinckii TaxID=170623 RepID=A0A1H6V528_9GAMM|nr:hypothetical protein SAMN04244579_02672 [Azotobacter beijerinckii]